MKRFDFPQIFHQVIGTVQVKTSPTHHLLGRKDSSHKDESVGMPSPKTLKLLNMKLPNGNRSHMRIMTQQNERQNRNIISSQKRSNDNRSYKGKQIIFRNIKIKIEKTERSTKKSIKREKNEKQGIKNIFNGENSDKVDEKKDNKIQNNAKEKEKEKGKGKGKGKVRFRISDRSKNKKQKGKRNKGISSQSSLSVSETNYNNLKKSQDRIKEDLQNEKHSKKKKRKNSNISERTQRSQRSSKQKTKQGLERVKISAFIDKDQLDDKKSKKKIRINEETIKKDEKNESKKKGSQLKRINTLQNIYVRKGSLQASHGRYSYTERNINESFQEQSESSKKSSSGTEDLRTYSKKSNFSIKRKVHFHGDLKNSNKQKVQIRGGLKKKKACILRKETKITSIENIVDDLSEAEKDYILKKKNMKRHTLTKNNRRMQDNIYTQLNYFNMRLQDTPKSCYEEDYEFLNRPTVIPMTVEYNEVETEEMRKNRFKMESQMIDMAVKMTKGYILKQVNAL